MAVIYDSYFEFDSLCKEIMNTDNSLSSVVVLNNKGRVVEIKAKEIVDTYCSPLKREMFFMQCVLQISMNKDHDDDLGKVQSLILEREKFTIISFEFFNYVILVILRPNSNPIQLKSVIMEKINNFKKIKTI